jgi:hypothetical protein
VSEELVCEKHGAQLALTCRFCDDTPTLPRDPAAEAIPSNLSHDAHEIVVNSFGQTHEDHDCTKSVFCCHKGYSCFKAEIYLTN